MKCNNYRNKYTFYTFIALEKTFLKLNILQFSNDIQKGKDNNKKQFK